MRILIILLVLFSCNNTGRCEDEKYEEIFKEMTKKEFRDAVTNRTLEVWNWAKKQSETEDTAIGRCFGLAKRLKMLIPLLALVLGGMIVALKFLTLFSLKGLGIGILLLIMNVAGWAAKLGAWKAQSENHATHLPQQTVHFHLHKDNDHYKLDHSGPGSGWYDRISDRLGDTNSMSEKLELLNMYKRLGLNVNNLSVYR